MPTVDLHTHTLASDGSLSPTDLVKRAYEKGVRCLAVTDHDTCAGLSEARVAANELGMQLINGIELSSQWKGMGIHIVGLNFDPHCEVMEGAVAQQYQSRVSRAEEIGVRLTKLKMHNVYERAQEMFGRPDLGRPHLAKAMIDLGYIRTEIEGFDRYLGSGKTGDVKMMWPSIEQVVSWIVDSGGAAVIAHPGKYKMTWAKLRSLVVHFKEVGGQAMEVSYGGENPDRLAQLSHIARNYGLQASVGSDFHNPKFHWTELGKYPPIRGDYAPVWGEWLTAS